MKHTQRTLTTCELILDYEASIRFVILQDARLTEYFTMHLLQAS